MEESGEQPKPSGWVALGMMVGTIVAMILSVIATLMVADMEPGEGVLIAISLVVYAGVVTWGLAGGPFPPLALRPIIMAGGMFPGITLMMSAQDRYPPFWPFWTGAALGIAFAVAACLATRHALPDWRTVFPKGAPRADFGGAVLLYLVTGVLFFQPMVLRINGAADAHSPLSAPGKVANMNVTHGKGGGPNITLSGPAAVYLTGDTRVDWSVYDAAHIGDTRCLIIHTGTFRLRWWELKPC